MQDNAVFGREALRIVFLHCRLSISLEVLVSNCCLHSQLAADEATASSVRSLGVSRISALDGQLRHAEERLEEAQVRGLVLSDDSSSKELFFLSHSFIGLSFSLLPACVPALLRFSLPLTRPRLLQPPPPRWRPRAHRLTLKVAKGLRPRR